MDHTPRQYVPTLRGVRGWRGWRRRLGKRVTTGGDWHPPGWKPLTGDPLWLLTLRVWLTSSWLDPRVRGFGARSGRLSLAFPITLFGVFPAAYLLGRVLL